MSQESSRDSAIRNKLFGALTHSTSTQLDDTLGLPLLPSDHTHLSLLPKVCCIWVESVCLNSAVHQLPRVPPVTISPELAPSPCGAPPSDSLSLLAAAVSMEDSSLLRTWEGWDARSVSPSYLLIKGETNFVL